MSTAEKIERIEKTSRRMRATFVGAYYLLTLLACAFVFFFRGGQAFAVHFVTSVFFIAITAFFYGLSKPEKKQKGD
jgi:VIT1/CCC1 family predicted Fe2+/Mn2+ transporter